MMGNLVMHSKNFRLYHALTWEAMYGTEARVTLGKDHSDCSVAELIEKGQEGVRGKELRGYCCSGHATGVGDLS